MNARASSFDRPQNIPIMERLKAIHADPHGAASWLALELIAAGDSDACRDALLQLHSLMAKTIGSPRVCQVTEPQRDERGVIIKTVTYQTAEHTPEVMAYCGFVAGLITHAFGEDPRVQPQQSMRKHPLGFLSQRGD